MYYTSGSFLIISIFVTNGLYFRMVRLFLFTHQNQFIFHILYIDKKKKNQWCINEKYHSRKQMSF